MATEFEGWLSDRLTQFNADGDVFSTYILGILDSEESQDEKVENLSDLLEGLGLDDGQVDPCERFQKEIWSKWSSVKDPPEKEIPVENTKKSDLGATLAAHAESQTKAFNQSKGHGGSTPQDDKDREAVKAAILAQYNNVVEESDASDDDDEISGAAGGCDSEDLMAKNTNAEAVSKAQIEQREKSKAAAQAKKDKDKEDREKQKKDQEDRKKKAQEKATKGERRR